jgi:hypothetical protein
MLNVMLVKALGFNYTKRVWAAMFTGAKHTIIFGILKNLLWRNKNGTNSPK